MRDLEEPWMLVVTSWELREAWSGCVAGGWVGWCFLSININQKWLYTRSALSKM